MTLFFKNEKLSLYEGSALDVLTSLPSESIHVSVTSPPYWGLRDYGVDPSIWGGDLECEHEWNHINVCIVCGAWFGALGLEPTPEMYVEHLVKIFRELRRVLREDGTFWLNLGDSYAAARGGTHQPAETLAGGEHGKMADGGRVNRDRHDGYSPSRNAAAIGLKHKDLVGIPWMVAFALRADGWWLRQDIIWCLSGETKVYARAKNAEGPAAIRDLVRSDPSTVQLWNGERWTQVLGWSSRRSETLRLTLRSGERIIASPNHRWPLVDERIVETRDLKVGDVLATTRLPEPVTPSAIPDDLAWFAGLYLAEGSRSDDAIQIAGHADEVERHQRVFAIAERYGGSAVIHTTSENGVSVVVHGALLDGALRHFIAGKTAHDKHLHPRAWRSPNATLRALMEGYLAGDGHNDVANGRWRLGFGNNPQLVDSFRTLAARLGATLTLSPSLAKIGKTRTFEAYRGEWRWQATDYRTSKQRAEIVAIDSRAETEVWDIGVEGEPHVFALASGVLTHNSKRNPMPESVRDRCTKAHEYLFLLSKSDHYYYDAEAIKEPVARYANDKIENKDVQETRNKRSVWTISNKPYRGAHFATFPPDLIIPCIMAGSSEKGCCSRCGSPWKRVISRSKMEIKRSNRKDKLGKFGRTSASGTMINPAKSKTLNWEPSCNCDADVVPCKVLDPFIGSGTTAETSLKLGRNIIGIDANKEYLETHVLSRCSSFI